MNVLLDLDGTLTDPAPGFVNCIRFALDELGIECPSDAEVASHIGPPLEETLFQLLGASQASQIPEAVRLYRKRYATEGLFENAVYSGIVEALESIRSSDAKIVLATSKPRVFAEKILVHFNLAKFFSGIYGSELDGTNSDKRDLLKHLLAQESLNPSDSVMVGDRLHDMRAAIANGVKPLGVLWGYGSLLELQEAGAQEIIHEPNQLPGAVVI